MARTESPESLLPYPVTSGERRAMSIKLRFGLLAGTMLLVFAGMFFGLRRLEHRQAWAAMRDAHADGQRQMERLLELDSLGLRQLAQDWADGNLVPGPTEAANWGNVARDYGVDAIWLSGSDGSLTVLHPAAVVADLPRLADGPDSSDARHFHVEFGTVWEIVRSPRTDGANGWQWAGRRWNSERLDSLGQQIGGRVRLVATGEPAAAPSPRTLVVERPWRDAEGRVVRTLRAERDFGSSFAPAATDAAIIRLLIVFGILLLIALALAVHRWVLRPLNCIGESLAEESPVPLAGLDGGAEFARLARLAEESFAQKEQLRREIDERRRAEASLEATQENLRQSIEVRSRLARNLHDTVIQAIYATGLGIESARAEIGGNPAAAGERLTHCRANLNDTIREVRGFINDLEPESLRRQPFAQALRSLAYTMQSLWVAAINVELDEVIAARFTPLQETHLLQIVREAISNALRHGEASRINIVLQEDADGLNALLKVQDNGRGFDPAQRTGEGRGLVNMTNRVRELNGSLRLQTQPGAGTTVVLRIPLTANPA